MRSPSSPKAVTRPSAGTPDRGWRAVLPLKCSKASSASLMSTSLRRRMKSECLAKSVPAQAMDESRTSGKPVGRSGASLTVGAKAVGASERARGPATGPVPVYAMLESFLILESVSKRPSNRRGQHSPLEGLKTLQPADELKVVLPGL